MSERVEPVIEAIKVEFQTTTETAHFDEIGAKRVRQTALSYVAQYVHHFCD